MKSNPVYCNRGLSLSLQKQKKYYNVVLLLASLTFSFHEQLQFYFERFPYFYQTQRVYWKTRTQDNGQTMEKTENDGKDDKRWKRRTNDGKDGQTMEKTDKRWKRRTRFPIDRPFRNTYRLKFRFVSYLLLKIANMSNSHRSNSDI